MKRTIYILTAFISAVTVAVLYIEYISEVDLSGGYFFSPERSMLIAAVLALVVLSAVQLIKHTPGLILIVCGFVFIASSSAQYNDMYYSRFSALLLLAAALIPAVYEFSHHGMMVRREPMAQWQSRWRWLTKAVAALAAFRSFPFLLNIMIDIRINAGSNILGSYSADILGISALICFAVFCRLMDRRTSALYRAFFTGCIIFDAVQTVFIGNNRFFSNTFPNQTVKALFIFLEIIYVLFILLILIHAFLSRRASLISQVYDEVSRQTGTPAENIRQ